ncbi:MAG: two-component sensor histidine kinase [Hydrocarboniphaga sp.]|uniref:sensor histidine kinase efflux regulator BaeS n=1 Tax=Hydrocarboniphaga sp. TaxID=2033016 RepID=UPI002619DE85|nr:sensor histidine kinase efflux regulator BaeS [Hydrocarboniphaga sp.]MDB5968106.1 two-component sensor histidine kinase [Hydrocarboniphaga sp.]
MKTSVTAKLFVAILATSLLVAVAMGVAARISFTQGFLGYVNEQGRARMESLMPDLVEAYRQHRNWDFLRDNSRAWFALIRLARPDTDPDKPGDQRAPMSDVEMTGLNLRVAVLDDQHQLVIGYSQIGPAAETRPIVVEGHSVGWLAMAPFEEVTVAADVRFQRQQLRANLIIGGLAGLLAAAVAFGLARAFLAPVRRIAGATRRLAAGNYSTRVPVSSSDEIGLLAGDFNQLATTLEKNEQMRRAFMADVSHELRTPLSVLQGEMEALEDGVRPLTTDAIRSLQAEARHLNKLVSDLYDLSLSDAGALTYRKVDVDVAEILHSSLDLFRERFASRGLSLNEAPSSSEMLVLADESRLRQLFVNLLENSLRYTEARPDGSGQLRVSIRREAGHARIDFEDSAPGVAPELLPRLFERFYRVEGSRNRAHGGAGLGLAICRNIVEAHGGRLSAAASKFGGVHMTVSLPLLASSMRNRE